RFRTHLSVAMDCPESRPVHVPDEGRVVAVHLTGPGRQQVLQGPNTALDPAATFPRSHEAWRTDAGIWTHQVILIYLRLIDNRDGHRAIRRTGGAQPRITLPRGL